MTEEQQIIDNSDLRKYRAEIPHMADDELGPHEYRLYGHYKRVCGEGGGTCWEAVNTTAKATQMSAGEVVESRYNLATRGYIELHKADDTQYMIITIVDRWLENLLRYAPDELLQRLGLTVHGMNSRSPGETKNDHDQVFNSSVVGSESYSDSETTTDKTSPTADLQMLELARAETRNPFAIWEDDGFGMLTPFTSDRLGDWIDTYGEESVKVALLSALMNDVKKPSYVDAALRRMFGESTSREVREAVAQKKGWERAAEESARDEEQRRTQFAAAREFSASPVLMSNGKNPHSVWEMSYGQLQLQMPKEAFDTWLFGTKLMAFEDENGIAVFTLGVRHVQAREWLEHRLKKPILRTLSQVAGCSVVIRFVLASEYTETQS